MGTATMGSPMTRDEALNWCVERLDVWPGVPATNALNHAPSGWEWMQNMPGQGPRGEWFLAEVGGPDRITEGDVLNRRNHPPEPTARPTMTRAQALEWIAEQLEMWPILGDTVDGHPTPPGWSWKLSSSDNWYLKNNAVHDVAILKAHWRDARNLLDQNSIGKAFKMSFQACGVSADIGQRVKVKTTSGNELIGTLAGAYGDQAWIVDCSGDTPGMAILRTNEITGFARVTERDEFVGRATDVMLKGNPAMSKHVAVSSAASMWNAGARFTDQDDK